MLFKEVCHGIIFILSSQNKEKNGLFLHEDIKGLILKNPQGKRRTKIFFSWSLVFLCILAIFLIVPFARTISIFVSTHWGDSLFGYLVLFVSGGTFLVLLFVLFFRLKIRSFSNYFWLSLVTSLYIYFTLKLWEVPVEAVHFLEYGLLGFFLFRALRFHMNDRCIYFIAFLSGSLVGTFDEILQWIVPLRLWDIRDVGLNALSSGLFQIGLWKGIQPRRIFPKIRAKSLKTLSLLLSINFVLLGLCLSNTPQRVSAYTKIFPALSFLQKEEVMNKFRKKHVDSEIGDFYSLLTLAELKIEDRENFSHNAQIIKEWKNRDYEEFLHNFHPLMFTFLYELRTHLDIRDKNFKGAQKTEDKDIKKKFFFRAYKENLILEKYFGQTLQNASIKWGKDQSKQVESYIDKSSWYSSPSSFGLFLSFSEKTMWTAIIGFLFILALFNLFLFRSQKFQ